MEIPSCWGCAGGSCSRQVTEAVVVLTVVMPAVEGFCGWNQRLRFQVGFGRLDSLAGGGLRGM